MYLLDAVDPLLSADPALGSVLEVHLAGVAAPADLVVAARSPVAQVHGYLSHSETLDLLRTADLLFLPMHDLAPGVWPLCSTTRSPRSESRRTRAMFAACSTWQGALYR